MIHENLTIIQNLLYDSKKNNCGYRSLIHLFKFILNFVDVFDNLREKKYCQREKFVKETK